MAGNQSWGREQGRVWKKPESPSLKSVQHGSLGSGRALRRQRLSEGKAVSQAAGEALQPGWDHRCGSAVSQEGGDGSMFRSQLEDGWNQQQPQQPKENLFRQAELMKGARAGRRSLPVPRSPRRTTQLWLWPTELTACMTFKFLH